MAVKVSVPAPMDAAKVGMRGATDRVVIAREAVAWEVVGWGLMLRKMGLVMMMRAHRTQTGLKEVCVATTV